jgi:hypothetical protein
MFIPAFTIPIGQLKSEEPLKTFALNPEYLWQPGLGDLKSSFYPSTEQLNNRYDVLRCLMASFTQVLFLRGMLSCYFVVLCILLTLLFQVDECNRVENRFLSLAVSKDMPVAHQVVYSLLNTVLKYDPRGSLPYTTQLMTDYDEKTVELSLNVLTLILHHNPSDGVNQARDVLAAVNDDDELKYIYDGFTRSLNNIVDSHNTYLPGSQRLIPFYEELLVGFWKVLTTNKNMRIYICKETDIANILVPLLFILQTQSKEPSKFPVVQMTAFTLLLLSGHREFGVALNRPFDIKVPLDLPSFTGTFADLLVISFCKTISNDKGLMKPLYDCLLTIIANVSPYTKTLSMISSLKLVNLFEAFAAPKYLYTSEKSPQFVHLLLETFNNLVQYQYEGNPHIVYSIMRRANIFTELGKKPDIEKLKKFIIEREQKKPTPVPESQLFLPTQQWVDSWKPKLPLNTIIAMINILNPEVEKMCTKQQATEEDVLVYLKKTTLVGLLPVPHTIVVRTFVTSDRIDVYLTTYCWGLIYLKHTDMFSARHIKLFNVNVDTL